MSISKGGPAKNCKSPATCLLGLFLLFAPCLSGFSQKEESFKEAHSYINNNRLGERLSVSFPDAESDMAKSTEVTLSEEEYFNSTTGRFDRRLIAVITGMGLGNTGLKLVVDDERQHDDFKACLDRFVRTEREFKANEETIREKTEAWMGESWNALSEGRKLGEVYFYPSKKPLSAEFKWDFELNRVWLSIGSRIMVERSVVPYILRFIENLEQYRNQFYDYRETMVTKNREIDDLLGVEPQS